MASEQELLASAAKHAKATSWTWDKYLARIRNDPSYLYQDTEWYECGGDMEKVARPGTAPPNPAPPNPTPPPSNSLATVQARMFLADSPEDCLQAPQYMVPVVTADHGYRYWYTPDLISKMKQRFGRVEAWCDCRISSGYVPGQGTGYDEAVRMTNEMGLDGPAWGQCETADEFDHAYAGGARRMIGQLAGLNDTQKAKIASKEVLITFELYRNKMPWQVPDYSTCGAGVGGNAIGVYSSDTEGASYYPVQQYKNEGYYVSKRDSVYGIGLQPADWLAL
jgi:hypothetical protein